MDLRERALGALMLADPPQKVAAVAALWAQRDDLTLDPSATLAEPAGLPGRPSQPSLVHPAQVPQRSPASAAGLATLVHAICHIEFNAINLALDAIWRFAHLPPAFYRDWLQVAAEEAQHFVLLQTELQALGHHYGDFAAHDGLWEMCQRTAGDVTARMALVPRTLEARGLDATPGIQQRLRQTGTAAALAVVQALDIILRDEVGHVAIGNRWYHWLCVQHGHEPLAHFVALSERYRAPKLKPPLNTAARRAAGFTELELSYLLGA